MIVTPFTQKIVFKADVSILGKVEEVLKRWCSALPEKSEFLINKMYANIFPLEATRAYAFDVSWHTPIGVLFSNWANDHNSFWIYIQDEEDLADFEAILRLNVNSSRRRTPFDQINIIKEQIAEGGYR